MKTTVTATITIDIDVDTLEPTISLDVLAEDDLPGEVIYSAVAGGCNATLRTLKSQGLIRTFDGDPEPPEDHPLITEGE